MLASPEDRKLLFDNYFWYVLIFQNTIVMVNPHNSWQGPRNSIVDRAIFERGFGLSESVYTHRSFCFQAHSKRTIPSTIRPSYLQVLSR